MTVPRSSLSLIRFAFRRRVSNRCYSTGPGLLVRHKPTAYGRATLGAKPFRRAPFGFGVAAVQR
jgi:hypothetical protein